jgi:dTDP-4-dehydrorhamnose 3,5-epimerase
MQSNIPGVILKPLKRFSDSRGWLTELFREDELPAGLKPVMGYVSLTRPGVARGPHEHRGQTDGFGFLFGEMRLTLWENRPGFASRRESFVVGAANQVFVLVPPGVVHAYENIGGEDALVFNFPDRLYAGRGKAEPVDEIRHEEIDSPFKL